MKKVKKDLILSSKILNKKYVIKCLIGITFAIILFVVFLLWYFNKTLPQYVNFSEKGKIDYKVYLEENNFFVNTIW